MFLHKNPILLFLLLFLAPLLLHSQNHTIQKFSDANGISSRIVRVAFQDRDGYLWIGGTKGLFKYDGISFQSFYHTPKDTSGFRADKVNAIQQTKDGVIWIGTTNGLHRMANDKVVYFPLNTDNQVHSFAVNELMVDPRDRLWASTNKGLLVLEKNNTSSKYEVKYPLTKNTVWGTSALPDDRTIVSTPTGIYLFVGHDSYDPIKLKLNFGDGVHFRDTYIFNIAPFSKKILLAETGKGIHKVTLQGDSLLYIDRLYNKKEEAISKEFIYDMYIDASKTIWLATWRNQYKKYQFKNGFLEAAPSQLTREQKSLISNHVLSITEDRQKNIWMCAANGLFKISKSNNVFHAFLGVNDPSNGSGAFNITATLIEKDSLFWMAGKGKIYRFHTKDLIHNLVPQDYHEYSTTDLKNIKKIYRDSKGRIWLCADNGLYVYRLNEKDELILLKKFTVKEGLKNKSVRDIVEVSPNRFMVTNFEALLDLEIPNGDFDKINIDYYQHKKDDPASLNGSYVSVLFKDQKNNLWVSTNEGLSVKKADSKKESFSHFTHRFGDTTSLSNNSVKNFFQDSQGRIWIGTQSGLNLYDESTNSFVQIGRAEGLPSDYILGIQEDSDGYLWLSTTSGLLQGKYVEESQLLNDIKYYTVREGLLDNINNINTLFVDKNSNVFVGSSKGLSVKNSKHSPETAKAFQIQLSSFKSTKKNKSGFYTIQDFKKGEEIVLEPKENSIKIQYAALDLSRPEFNYYRHKLLPVNDSWIETNNRSDLDFYELLPGDYQLILDAKNPGGDWQQNPLVVNFVVKPPWWKSNWAYVFYGLLLAGLSRFIFVARMNKRIESLKQEAKLQKALLHEREQMRSENAADFHDELGASLTKISMYLTLAERSAGEVKEQQKWLDKIRDNAKALSGSFRDLLWVIDPKKDSLDDLYFRLKTFGEELFEDTNTNFTAVKDATNLKDYKVDPQIKKQVILVFKEGLTNASKYARASEIRLEFTLEGIKHFQILLNDNGSGFSFDEKSTGNGLKNMQSRADKINANLQINTSPQGTHIALSNIPHLEDQKTQKE